jgi:hypothetical protein
MDGAPELELVGTTLRYNGFAVGEASNGRVELNLGWCRTAGLGVRILGDPADEADQTAYKYRKGLLIDRPGRQ